MGPPLTRTCLLAGAVGLAVAACSGEVSVNMGSSVDPGDEAEQLIEGELADEAGLGPLTADCSDAVEPGGSFECTGTTGDGQVVAFTADGAGAVDSTNLATPAGISLLAEEAGRVLAEQNAPGSPPPPIVCDDSRGLVLEVGAALDCEVTDPESGDVLAAVITITDPESLGFRIDVTG